MIHIRSGANYNAQVPRTQHLHHGPHPQHHEQLVQENLDLRAANVELRKRLLDLGGDEASLPNEVCGIFTFSPYTSVTPCRSTYLVYQGTRLENVHLTHTSYFLRLTQPRSTFHFPAGVGRD